MTDETNPMDMLAGLLSSAKNSKPLELPEDVPSNEELEGLTKRTLKAVMLKENLSGADAPLLTSLVIVYNSFTEY